MNYDEVENLSEDDILELYDYAIENGSKLKAACTLEIKCHNGITGYQYEHGCTMQAGYRSTNYVEYGNNYTCSNSAYSYTVCRLCGRGVYSDWYVTDNNSRLYSDNERNCQDLGGTIIVNDSHSQVCKISSK